MLEFEFSSHGAGMIHAYRWEPEGQPRGVVQIHGIARHILRDAVDDLYDGLRLALWRPESAAELSAAVRCNVEFLHTYRSPFLVGDTTGKKVAAAPIKYELLDIVSAILFPENKGGNRHEIQQNEQCDPALSVRARRP